ncbi:hypothetical protein BJ917_1528 [Pseudomonas sp. WPR_5_2]|uniref:DUF6603 domain-containing protein n=1 Tax=Pseudomonas sp. WPR_5_2 TaxID=1907371 RepID=UPI000EB513BF|nr:DUF6603 domain-containing protein [Pseudomonas sp. WPR_5_2]RKS28632.1 hypothetical protein BJ917_1528 [Pseudomonas sp. WPR_5_2]
MNDKRGTLEALINQLAGVLSPLTRLTPLGVQALLPELGLPVTDAQAASIAPILTATTNDVGNLISFAQQLEAAIASGDLGQIIGNGANAIDQIAKVILGLDQLKAGIAGLGLPGAGPILADLPAQLTNFLLVATFARSQGANQLLELTGILERTDHNVGVFDPDKPFYTTNQFHFDRLGGWLSNPAGQLGDLYGWGTGGFDGKKFLAALDRAASEFGLPSLVDSSAATPLLDLIFVTLTPRTDLNPRGLELQLNAGLTKGSIQVGTQSWNLALRLDTNIPSGAALILQPGSIKAQPPDATTLSGTVSATYSYLRDPSNPLRLLTIAGSSGITVEEVDATAGLTLQSNGTAALTLGVALKRGKVLITTDDADGFIGKILAGIRVENNFDLSATYTMAEGLHFEGSSTLEIQLASHVSLGPINIEALTLKIGIKGQQFPVGITVDLKAILGPLTAVVHGIGFEVDFSLVSNNKGRLGPIDLHFGFKPPDGIGLSLDAGIIQGGGFLLFDSDHEEYAGALELVFSGFLGLHAVGLITTRMPDGSKGFSLLIIITVDFGPGIQLGFGFTLLAVGGLLGLNRAMLFQPLVDGIRTNAISSIMFPQNVVANAMQIISDLKAIFPPQDGTFLISPMAKLGWGEPTLISLSLGVIIEIPPGDIVILGILKLALPAEDLPVLVIQVNFAGVLEFDKSRLYFFASLFDSHILFITLEGEMGLLMVYGHDANFVLSVGGFHPQFSPPPLPFPTPRRIELTLINESYARIRSDGYFAITSNTCQFGSHSEYFFGFNALSVQGSSGFDALFQFSPFHFIVSISTSFSVRVFGVGVYGVGINLTLEGPTPWHAHGTALLSFFLFSVDIGIDFTWGDDRNTTLPPVALMSLLGCELSKQSNWRALLPSGSNLLVSLRKLDASDATMVLHPVGTLQVSQRAIPLDFTLDKAGNQAPNDANRFGLTVSTAGLTAKRNLQESFALAQFKNLTDADKLSQAAYTPLDSGLELSAAGSSYASGTAITCNVRYDLTIIDMSLRRVSLRFFVLLGSLFNHFLVGSSVARSSLSAATKAQTHPFAEKIAVNPETFAVAFTANNQVFHNEAAAFSSQAKAHDYVASKVAADPTLAGSIHVIPRFEVAA